MLQLQRKQLDAGARFCQRPWPEKGCSASDGVGGENNKHKMFIFLSEIFVTMLNYVNIYSLLVIYSISVLHNTVHKYELYKTRTALRLARKTVSLRDRKINLHNTSSIRTSQRGTNTSIQEKTTLTSGRLVYIQYNYICWHIHSNRKQLTYNFTFYISIFN